jgi:hypothetical protein
MAYNFKSIADVEVVAEPAESANVLIEENGVIKKAPKTAVGGAGSTGGNEELDLDIDMISDGERNWSYTTNFINTFENIKNKLLNGIKPKCKAKVLATAWAGDSSIKAVEVFDSLQVYYQPEDGAAEISERIVFLGVGANVSPKITLFLDGELFVSHKQ